MLTLIAITTLPTAIILGVSCGGLLISCPTSLMKQSKASVGKNHIAAQAAHMASHWSRVVPVGTSGEEISDNHRYRRLSTPVSMTTLSRLTILQLNMLKLMQLAW